MENNAKHGDIRYLMIFAYLPTWINGKFYFWEHYFIKQRFHIYFNHEINNYFGWRTIPIHIERYEYEIYKFGKQITNFIRS